jgi:MSHA biogenesis protein MshP
MTRPRQRGFAYIAAIVLLLVVAGISVALLRLTSTQQGTVNQALLGAKASQAARAGVEWMVYRILNDGADGCPAAADLADFRTDSGFRVSVGCTVRPYKEGETVAGTPAAVVPFQKFIYEVDAVACNGAASACPDRNSISAPDYVERRRKLTICATGGNAPCY